MHINEIYLGINGEGFASAGRQAMIGTGVPTVLVRTQGCPIRCSYCDSAFTWDGTEAGRKLSIEALLAEIRRVARGYQNVLLTGGEPGIQKDLTDFCHAVKNAGFTLAIETGGGCDIGVFGDRPAPDSIILDVKCPSAGQKAVESSWIAGNLERLRPVDQIKFVIADHIDWDFMIHILDAAGLAIPGTATRDQPVIIASPLFDQAGNSNASIVAEWILNSSRAIHLGVQIHKFIWPADRRRV